MDSLAAVFVHNALVDRRKSPPKLGHFSNNDMLMFASSYNK